MIVPTRNRPSNLKRIIKYWGKWPVTIIVLDGSDSPQTARDFELSEATLVVHADVDFAARIAWCASQLSTPYACLQPDDDFVLCRGTAQAIEWLDNNPDFVAYASDGQFFTPDYRFTTSAQGRWLRSSDPRVRLLEHFKNYSWSYVYAIHRSNELRQTLRAVADSISTSQYLESPHSVAGELAFEICGSLLGPIGCGSTVMFLKAVGNQSDYLHSATQRWDEWLQDPKSESAVSSWSSTLSTRLAPTLGRPASEINQWILSALNLQLDIQLQVTSHKPGVKDGVRVVPVPLDFAGRISFFLRPRSHTSSDHRVGLAKRLIRKAHRLAFRLVRATFRTMATMGGRPVGKLPDSDWNWGDPDDMADFWRSIDDDDDAKG